MRNCFVPKCDHANRYYPKRAMFNAPKDPVLFEKWAEVLPKHRKFKLCDRVCELHFNSDDVLRYWVHKIQGVEEKMEREKPSLRANAVPFYDPNESLRQVKPCVRGKFDTVAHTKTRTTKLPKKGAVRNNETNGVQGQEKTTKQAPDSEKQPIKEGNDVAPVSTNVLEERLEDSEEVTPHPEYETLFDEVYEVELPSTVWGIHRDVQRAYIAFTKFDPTLASGYSKSLVLHQTLKCRVSLCGSTIKEENLSTVDAGVVSHKLSELDGIERMEEV